MLDPLELSLDVLIEAGGRVMADEDTEPAKQVAVVVEEVRVVDRRLLEEDE